jgi:putative transposase
VLSHYRAQSGACAHGSASRDDAWSSYNAHARRAMDPHLGGHALFDGLGASPADRRKAYRELFRTAPDADFADALRAATNGGWALGDARFKRQIAKALDRQGSRSSRP